MKSFKINDKLLSWAPPVLVGAGIISALLLQHLLGWVPCPMCIVQRVTALALFVCLAMHAAAPAGSLAKRFVLAASVVPTIAGVSAGFAHLYILAAPDATSCGPGIARFVTRLVDALPGSEWLLEGAGMCENAKYKVLGLPLPLWSILLHLTPLTLIALKARYLAKKLAAELA